MATMEDYCEAIKGAKVPSTLGPRCNRFYDETRFLEFVNTDIDMRDLGQHMANFTQAAGVAQALHTIRGDMQSGLQQKLGYGGSLFQIGSFYDGSKTGRLNEMDCLYVVNESDVVVQQASLGTGHFRVYMQGVEVKPRDINKKLIAAMKETLSGMTLPDGWTHGGYCSQEFSGVRCNGPAVTAMFCNNDESHISLDVSIVFPLTSRLQGAQNFPVHLKDHCQSLAVIIDDIQREVPRKAIAPADLHLIGNLVTDTWQPTTALAEAEILRILDTDCSVKGTVDVCKALSSKHQKWYEENNTQPERQTNDESVPAPATSRKTLALKNLNSYMAADSDSREKMIDSLNNNMAFEHIWLSSADRNDFKEVLKADVSTNTAAIKHIVLKTALQIKGAFSRHNKTHRDCLLRAVFEELSDPSSADAEHAILHGVELSKFSLSVNLSHAKDDVARDLQEQCRVILDHGLKKSESKGVSHIKKEQSSNLCDYCYKMDITLKGNGCCSVGDVEQIAIATSAMMNTSGGVLEVQTNTRNLGRDSGSKSTLQVFHRQLLRIISTQENWIPKQYISRYVKECVQEQSSKMYLFVNKTNDLVTHCTYAFMHESGEVKLITDHDVTCRLLRECSCEGEDKCQHHKDKQAKLESALSDCNQLNADTALTYILRNQHFCRHYRLHDRPLTEVLCTKAVSSDIKELVSALANTDGGSIFLGVTFADTPVVRGYALGDTSVEQLDDCLSQIINGQAGADVTIWSTVKSIHQNWRLFYHRVSADSDVEKYVIEVRVRKCHGGMFCSMPLCFDVSPSGDILPLKQFGEWKNKMLLTYEPVSSKVDLTWEDHFSEEVVKEAGLPSAARHPGPEEQTITTTIVEDKDLQTSHVFQWWLVDNEDVTSESLRFDHCCARELADDAIDIQKPFTFFPPVETVVEQYENATDIYSALTEIEQIFGDGKGAGIVIENMAGHLAGELMASDILPIRYVCDIIVLKANCRPYIISVLMNDCDKDGADLYSRTVTRLLKRLCLLTYRHWCDSSTHLCFQRQLYYIGYGFGSVEENLNYLEEYLRPTAGTLDVVRHTLAGILLHCEPLTDRFGDIMIRHLSFIQAKILLEKRSKVTVIEGKAGSGKSVLALEAMRRIKQHNKDQSQILFICRGRGLAEYVKYQTSLMHIHVDIQTVQLRAIEQMNEEYFGQYTDVFIDDAHALPLTGHPNCRGMYRCLLSSLRKPNSHAYILLDPDMQDYRGCIPMDFTKEIQHMAQKTKFIRRQDVKTRPLGKILRNSTRICQLMGAYLGDEIDELRNIRNLTQDGAYIYIIEDLAKTKNFLLSYGDDKVEEEDAISVICLTDDEDEEDDGDNENEVHDGGDIEVDDEEEKESKDHSTSCIFKAPFVSRDISNAIQHKMDDNRDLDAAAFQTLEKLKLFLRAALKDSVYEEHMEENDNDEEAEEVMRVTKNDDHDNEEDDYSRMGHDEKAAVERAAETTLVSRLQDVLEGTMYQGRHVTILTEKINDKTWIQDILRCAKYQIQDSTIFPVKDIVVDTLENFEGLESPVILFIVPESWGTGYVGSLKYRLCIATRAISRLEFLVPWDPTGREHDLEELRRAFKTEPPIDYGSLKVTREHKIQAEGWVIGMCYFNGRLYVTEQRDESVSYRYRLAVYTIRGQDTVTLLDSLDLGIEAGQPHVDRHSGHVYIPCRRHRGVRAVMFDGRKLIDASPILGCVGHPVGIAVVSNTLYICDWDSNTVCLVDAIQDRVTARLQAQRWGRSPMNLAVLADTILVMYGGPRLALYRRGVHTPGKALPNPPGLQSVPGVTTDHHSSFLLVDNESRAVYVLDVSGNLTHTIPIPGDREPRDCTVVGRQLWVACRNGHIIVMSSS